MPGGLIFCSTVSTPHRHPVPDSPAGQVLKRAAYFMRQEVQRSATERDKAGRKLAYASGNAPNLSTLEADSPIAPIPT